MTVCGHRQRDLPDHFKEVKLGNGKLRVKVARK